MDPTEDPRAAKLLARTPVPKDHVARLQHLVAVAQERARAGGLGPKLRYTFEKEAVAIIVGCNQFLRLHRAGPAAGRVAMWLDDGAKKSLREAGFTLHEPEGVVFRMFGWTAVDPMEGDATVLDACLAAAFDHAAAAGAPKM